MEEGKAESSGEEKAKEGTGKGILIALSALIVILAVLLGYVYYSYSSIVELKESKILDKDKTVNLPAGANMEISYSTPYAGYIKINFTSSGGVYFWVGNSQYVSYNNGYYSRYPPPGDTATSGSFTVPVFPGTTKIYIRNPGILVGVTVTYTLEYVY
ncbi:MAG: hypothetical protein GU347_02780 [Desulfurococcales archaeon]|jgi:hypothetical protein|nr:hypothetical protein [Desulfurococcales archaeon]